MEETVLLKFEVDQGDAERRLIEVNKSLLNNKKAAQDLAAAYKKGEITQEEYVRQNIQLQNQLKKEQNESQKLNKLVQTESNSRNALRYKISQLVDEYDNLNTATREGSKRAKELQDELRGLQDQLTKSDKAAGLFKTQIGNYPEQLLSASKNMDIAGVSIGGLAEGFTSLLNPATATVAVIGALGAAYARSTLGAKDLSFASNELGEVTTILTNKFAGLITSAQDGEGALTKLLNVSLGYIANQTLFGNALKLTGLDLNKVAKDAKDAALALEIIEDLERDLLTLRAENNDRLEDNQELITEINEEQTKYVQKVADANKIIENIRTNRDGLLKIERAELEQLQKILSADAENEDKQTAVKQKILEISKIERDATKQIERTQKMLDNINETEDKRLEQERKKLEQFKAEAEAFVQAADQAALEKFSNVKPEAFGEGDAQKEKGSVFNEKDQNDALKEVYGERADLYNKDTQAYINTERSRLYVIDSIKKGELTLNQAYADINSDRANTYTSDAQNYIRSEKAKQQANIETLGTISGNFNTLSGLFKKGSEAQKAFALASIFADEAKAIAALTAASSGNPFNAVTEGGAGIAQYATGITQIIANIAAAIAVLNEGFADGGYTGNGGKYQPMGVVHGNEYVIPSETVNKYGPSYFDRYLPGYSDGGYVTTMATSDINNSLIIANAFKNLPPIYASWKEFSLTDNRVKAKENYATLTK